MSLAPLLILLAMTDVQAGAIDATSVVQFPVS
jgi:hypothetical protein